MRSNRSCSQSLIAALIDPGRMLTAARSGKSEEGQRRRHSRNGLVLTIGYRSLEAEEVWRRAMTGVIRATHFALRPGDRFRLGARR